MYSSTFAALFFCLAAAEVYGTPLADFFQKIHEKPVTTYQCFRNTTSFEDSSATGLTILWDGQSLPNNEAVCNTAYSKPGSKEKTTFQVYAEYVRPDDKAIVVGEGITVELYILPPYNEKAYYFREVITPSGNIGMKIYDTSATCENAQILWDQVCSEPCDLQPTR